MDGDFGELDDDVSVVLTSSAIRAERQTVTTVERHDLGPRFGGNSFYQAMRLTKDVLERSTEAETIPSIIFISDGADGDPSIMVPTQQHGHIR